MSDTTTDLRSLEDWKRADDETTRVIERHPERSPDQCRIVPCANCTVLVNFDEIPGEDLDHAVYEHCSACDLVLCAVCFDAYHAKHDAP